MEEKEERGSERQNNEREKRECVRKKKRESENVTERERERVRCFGEILLENSLKGEILFPQGRLKSINQIQIF